MRYDDLVGTPFVDGGRSKEGIDCWGLAKEMFSRQGIKVNDYNISAMNSIKVSRELKGNEPYWEKLSAAQKGCLVLLRLDCQGWANHVGVCIDENRFIHAYRRTGVVIDRLSKWKSRIVGYYKPKV